METRKPKEITMTQQQWDAACDEVVRLRAELAEAQGHAKVLGRAYRRSTGSWDCGDNKVNAALAYTEKLP